MEFNLKDGAFAAYLVTTGRKSGREHRIPLRIVFYAGRFYASRTNGGADWLKNVIANPNVSIELEGRKVTGTAKIVEDEELVRKVSMLKYGDERSNLSRIAVEITPK